MEEKRSGEDRRDCEISHEDIYKAVKHNSARIETLETKLDALGFPADWEDILRNVAAVGRTGRMIKTMVIWVAPLATACIAVWHYFTNYDGGGPQP